MSKQTAAELPLEAAAVERDCPWPPTPSGWWTLDGRCLETLNRLYLDDGWRRVLDDPGGTRAEVVAALDRSECRVPTPVEDDGTLDWPGETRPDLREACGAGAMVRLADLQDRCVEWLHTDWQRVYDIWRIAMNDPSESQTQYYRLVDGYNRNMVRVYWEVHTCRSVRPDAFDWIDALPAPPGDLSSPLVSPARSLVELTQKPDLYEAARRLGWEFPDRMLRYLEYEATQKNPAPKAEMSESLTPPETRLRGIYSREGWPWPDG